MAKVYNSEFQFLVNQDTTDVLAALIRIYEAEEAGKGFDVLPLSGGVSLEEMLSWISSEEDRNDPWVIDFVGGIHEAFQALAISQWENLMGANPSGASSWEAGALALKFKKLLEAAKDFQENTGEIAQGVYSPRKISDGCTLWKKEKGGDWEIQDWGTWFIIESGRTAW